LTGAKLPAFSTKHWLTQAKPTTTEKQKNL